MKKLVLSAAVAVMGLVGVNAQNFNMEAAEIGARAGYNLSNLSGDTADELDTKSLSGYHAGLFVEIPVGERFSIQPEVMYSTQGAKFEAGAGELELKTQNINVPVLAKFYVADGFNLQVGPQFGFNTGADWEYDGSLFDTSDEIDDDALAGFNFGAVVGAGYKLPQGLTIDARYNFGLTNIMDEDNQSLSSVNISDDNDFKNGVFQVGLGYSF